jgi:hypothetical protein
LKQQLAQDETQSRAILEAGANQQQG